MTFLQLHNLKAQGDPDEEPIIPDRGGSTTKGG